jgi:hypothetical protein
VFFHWLGQIRDRDFEPQRYRASGLNLVPAAIVLCDTVYLGRATNAVRSHGPVDDLLLPYLFPLGWEHNNLTVTTSGAAQPRSALANSDHFGTLPTP